MARVLVLRTGEAVNRVGSFTSLFARGLDAPSDVLVESHGPRAYQERVARLQARQCTAAAVLVGFAELCVEHARGA